jgi:peptidyl-dipeptidase Dcp
MRLALAIAVVLLGTTPMLSPVAFADSKEEKMSEATQANPLLAKSTLPFGMPAFDKIKDEHFAPALKAAIEQHQGEIKAIAEDKRKADFDNTIVAMEKSGQLLTRTMAVFSNLTGANTNETLEAVDAEYSPKLAAHIDSIYLNAKLFARLKSLYDARAKLGLDAESLRLLERYHTDFVRAGAKLDAKKQARVKAINAELAGLQTTFGQNLLKANKEASLYFADKAELEGLSEAELSAAAAEAKARGKDKGYVLALMNTSQQPALAALKNRETRAKLLKASLERASSGANDNRPVLAKVVKLRAERAALLGYANHAAYVLEDQTAKTTSALNELIKQVAPAAVANAKREAADMQALVDKEAKAFPLSASDWSYYAEKVRVSKYAFDESELRPYFELNNVLENGVFFAATKLYGITFKRRPDLPAYRDDVQVYEVFDVDGKPLAIFLADWYARSNKRGGAWMNEYVSQSGLLGNQPVIGNHLNIPKPPAGEPTLMTADEVNTMFHEFGHALHGMFSKVKYPRFSGTNVPTDFVEYPSQVNEMWMTWPEVLKNYAKHYKTGAPIPPELIAKMEAAKTFNQGFATTEYIAATLLDQAYHQVDATQAPSTEQLLQFEAKALSDAGVAYDMVPPRYRSTYFSHIVGGYAAGYYSYIWSEVLDAESVLWFKENGGLSRKNGDWFRGKLLSRGGSIDAMEMFREFRGRAPSPDPLLKKRGLK